MFAPLETKGSSPLLVSPRVQPIQASPYVQDLRHIMLHPFSFSRFPTMLLSPLSFLARSGGCPKRYFALNLLPLWGYLTSAEAAHYRYILTICIADTPLVCLVHFE